MIFFFIFDVLLKTQEIFWITSDLEGFFWMNKWPYLNSSFVIHFFHDLGCNFISKKNQKNYILLPFAFLSTCYLVSLMNCHILHCLCLKKAKFKIFWGPKYGLTVLTAFSGKFQLNFCLLFFLFFFSLLKK